ncbi:MAG: rhamnulokinase [bacterium]|nr:rhamnulokinase [bacterium]
MQYYLAVDIGASSGRHILSHIEDGKIVLEEIHRFQNGMIEKDGHLVWDSNQLFKEIVEGMKQCKKLGKIPSSMGVDTWGVDFALLDENDHLIGDTVGYRDKRTQGMDKQVYEQIKEEALYERTGIQKAIFNTIYQLMALKTEQPEQLKKAKTLLLMPDYFHYLLTGKKAAEYTNASTTQLLNPETKDWDYELIDLLGYPKEIFREIKLPGFHLGEIKEELQKEVGYSCEVVLPATHDTGSAVMAVPSNSEDVLYISSGTWSLMGTELKRADCSKESCKLNLTNEGGYDYRFRYLKNIMGMWMINSARNELAKEVSFAEICSKAANEKISSIVDANDDRFLAPKSMVKEVQKACEETGQQVPKGIVQVAAVIYHSLAECYAKTVNEIEQMTGIDYPCIHIVGGGCNAVYLNELTAKACKKTVYTGPVEATAIGNVTAQMIAAGELTDLKEARKCIFQSFPIHKFEV